MTVLCPAAVESKAALHENFESFFASKSHSNGDATKPDPRPSPYGTLDEQRWGIILAGGDGNRLRSLTRMIYGDDRPKQFCNILGRQSLFMQTRQRAAQSIAPERTVIALTGTHEKFYERDLAASRSQRLVQPQNRGTAPPMILSLLYIADRAPDALVAILPSDHYYSDEGAFTDSLESAFRLAGAHPESVVLLGAQPRGPEVDFGWLELGASVGENAFRLRGFEEKPGVEVARRLFVSGGLWNTFVMVGSASAFLWMSFVSLPGLFTTLRDALPICEQNGHLCVPSFLYEGLQSSDFSRQVLSFNAHRLLAMRLKQVDWHDLGHPERVVSVVRSRGKELPSWISAWDEMYRPSRNPIFQS